MIAPINKRDLLARFLGQAIVDPLIRRWSSWNGLLVVNYHRIGTPNGSLLDWELWSASEEDFDAQVSYLVQNFDLVRPDDLDSIHRRRRGRYVMITFDDGYRDNFDLAFPILHRHGATATFFLTTGFLDHPQMTWWDEIAWMVRTSDRAAIRCNEWLSTELPFDDPDRTQAVAHLLTVYKQLGQHDTERFVKTLADETGSGRAPTDLATDQWMTWDMVREMHRAGMAIGGHTVSHPVLARHELIRQEEEISRCQQRIQTEIGVPVSAFSYPVGSRNAFDERTQSLLKKHGFQSGFSYYGGFNTHDHWSPYDLRRVPIERDVTLPEFRSLLSAPQVFA